MEVASEVEGCRIEPRLDNKGVKKQQQPPGSSLKKRKGNRNGQNEVVVLSWVGIKKIEDVSRTKKTRSRGCRLLSSSQLKMCGISSRSRRIHNRLGMHSVVYGRTLSFLRLWLLPEREEGTRKAHGGRVCLAIGHIERAGAEGCIQL